MLNDLLEKVIQEHLPRIRQILHVIPHPLNRFLTQLHLIQRKPLEKFRWRMPWQMRRKESQRYSVELLLFSLRIVEVSLLSAVSFRASFWRNNTIIRIQNFFARNAIFAVHPQ